MNKQKQQAPTGFMVVHPKHGTIMAGNDLNQLVKLAGAVLRRKVLAEVSFVVLPPSPEDGLITGSMWVDGDRSSVLAEVADLETIDQVFQRCLLPRGEMTFKGRAIEPRAIRKTFLLTVEGEKDDICSVGQTLAAQDLCSGLRPYMKSHHLQAGVGHYGVFSGRRWDTQVYPVVRNHIMASV